MKGARAVALALLPLAAGSVAQDQPLTGGLHPGLLQAAYVDLGYATVPATSVGGPFARKSSGYSLMAISVVPIRWRVASKHVPMPPTSLQVE